MEPRRASARWGSALVEYRAAVITRRALVGILCAAVLFSAGCEGGGGGDPSVSPVVTTSSAPTPTSTPTPTPTPSEPSESTATLPEADPAFTKHFDAEFYQSTDNEFAPFGTPEAAEIVVDWGNRRDELGDCSTVAKMAAADDVKIKELEADAEDGDPDADLVLVGYGFALPYLTGKIDPEGKRVLTDAVKRMRTFYAENDVPEFRTMLRDLKSFKATDC